MKQQLRRRAKGLAKTLDTEWRSRASADVLEQVRCVLKELDYKSIGVYMPMQDEVDICPLYPELEAEGKVLCLPRVLDAERMAFFRYRVGDTLQRDGAYSIDEPTQEAQLCREGLDVLLVPAIHYYNNYRLGRGKGYYDRYIAEYEPQYLIGLSLGLLGEEAFSPDAWDKPMTLSLHPKI